MNKYGETIVLKVNKDKCLAGFYALGFEPKEIMGVLYQVSEDAFTTPKLITIINGQTHIVEIEYCPKCGRSLKEEEE